MSELKESEIHIAIAGIKELAFQIDEADVLPDMRHIGINFEQGMNVLVEEHKIEFNLTVRVFAQEETEKNLISIRTLNTFYVKELKDFATDTENLFNFPDVLLITILGLSISHTRALLATRTQGTRFDSFYIPIVNPTDLANKLFNLKNK